MWLADGYEGNGNTGNSDGYEGGWVGTSAAGERAGRRGVAWAQIPEVAAVLRGYVAHGQLLEEGALRDVLASYGITVTGAGASTVQVPEDIAGETGHAALTVTRVGETLYRVTPAAA